MIRCAMLGVGGVALVALVFAACNGELKVDSEQSALDGGGAGGAGGASTSGGSGGALPDGSLPVQFPVGVGDPSNDPSCPGDSPSVDDSCGTEGQWCRYTGLDQSQNITSYFYCGCWEAGENDLRWSCTQAHSDFETCPSEPPNSGSSCEGSSTCYYVPQSIVCTCSPDSPATWECLDNSAPLPEELTSVDPTTPINELTDAEREAWCTWYLQAYQPPDPNPQAGPIVNGWTTNTGCSNGFSAEAFMCNAMFAQLPVEYCKGNLSISSCTAPLSELSDCVLTVMSRSGGACLPATHGCARYMEKPNCAGTMALEYGTGTGGAGGGNCTLQVE